jgi:hypothetical protein
MANAYNPYYSYSGNAPDAYGTPITWVKRTKGVDVVVWDNAALISASYTTDTGELEGDIELEPGVHQFPLACRMIRVRNKTAGSVARYLITGFVMISDYA